MDTIKEMQELIDENKEDLPNSLYLNLSNKLLKCYKEEEEQELKDEVYCEVQYVYNKIDGKNEQNCHHIRLSVRKQIVKLNRTQYLDCLRHISIHGYTCHIWLGDNTLFNLNYEKMLYIPVVETENSVGESDITLFFDTDTIILNIKEL